jgi:hypothetical protein
MVRDGCGAHLLPRVPGNCRRYSQADAVRSITTVRMAYSSRAEHSVLKRIR